MSGYGKGTHGGSWNDERVELLKDLWGRGLSASQCAKRLGGVSRNGVIGKVVRLGLQKRSTGHVKATLAISNTRRTGGSPFGFRPAKTPDQKAPKAQNAPPPITVSATRVYVLPEARPLPQERSEDAALCSDLLALGAHMCRWPIGDPLEPGFGFCGRDQAGDGPYCCEHTKRAYAPPTAKKAHTGNELMRALRRYVG